MGFGGPREQRKQPRLNFDRDVVDHEVSERLRVEFVAGGFSLNPPEVAVGVEDSPAEEFFEEANESVAFGVVVEVGLENVLYVVGVCCDDAVDSAGTEEDGGVGWAVAEDVGSPLQEAVTILQELR